jgi:hypothetical protein
MENRMNGHTIFLDTPPMPVRFRGGYYNHYKL